MPDTEARPQQNGRTSSRDQLAIFSELVSRIEFAKRHGMQYGDDRDVYKVGGYPRNLTYSDFEALYERDGLARKLVDMPAETTWRSPPEVVEPGAGGNGTEFSRAWQELADRLRVWSRFERLDKVSRKGRYGVLLIGTGEGSDQRLTEPLPTLRGADDVLYLDIYSEAHARIHKLVDDPKDSRNRQPEIYHIDLGGDIRRGSVQRQSHTRPVHWTRVVHLAEDLVEDDIFGTETLRPVYNDILDLQKVRTSTAEAFWQRVAGILQAEIDPEAQVTDDQIEQLDEHLQELYHELRKTFWGQGVSLSRLAETEPDPSAAARLYLDLIGAGSPIPKRMLVGSETGERSSTEDQKSYLGHIAERHIQHAEPNLLRPFIDRLVEHRALPRPGQDGYEVVWPDLFQEPAKDVAEANRARAETAKALTPVGGDPMELVEIDEDRNVWPVPRAVEVGSPFGPPDNGEDGGEDEGPSGGGVPEEEGEDE